jgi:hypothetical protein
MDFFCSAGEEGYQSGWQRVHQREQDIMNKDKVFSLSSVLSRASLELIHLEEHRLELFSRNAVNKKYVWSYIGRGARKAK